MTPNDPPEVPDGMAGLRWLKGLVIALTLTMIAAGLVVIYLMITRWPAPAPDPFQPDTLVAPQGSTVMAVTRTRDWWTVVLRLADGTQILQIYDLEGALIQTITLPEPVAPQ